MPPQSLPLPLPVKPILKSVFEERKNIMTTLAASLVATLGNIDFIKAHRHRLK